MSAVDVFTQGFTHVGELVHASAEDLRPEELSRRLDSDANPVGWLLWHIGRVQDQVLSATIGEAELWSSDGWDARFELEGNPSSGEGHTSEEVAAVPVDDIALILEYCDAANRRALAALERLGDAGLDADSPLAPGLTNGQLLVLVLGGVLQHAGQAAYVRGILLRARG